VKRIYSLKGKKLFKEIYSNGKRKRGKGIAVFVLTAESIDACRNEDRDIKIGITVGKKLGKAHYRNLIKRRIRSVCREILPEMKGGFRIIINPHFAVKEMSFPELKDDICGVFRKAGLLK